MDTVAPIRYIRNLGRVGHETESRNECDSHADTCVAGHNFVLYSHFVPQRFVEVSGFDGKRARTKLPIASVCSVYDHPETSVRYLLVLHEALYAKNQRHTLLNPNQLRCNGLVVHDVPVQFDPSSSHSIQAVSEPGDVRVVIPLTLSGIMSGFSSRRPTDEELHEDLPRIIMTSDEPWNPRDPKFERDEIDVIERRRLTPELRRPVAGSYRKGTSGSDNQSRLISAVRTYRNTGFSLAMELMERPVGVSNSITKCVKGDAAMEPRSDGESAKGDESVARDVLAIERVIESNTLTPIVLSKRWNIGLAKAAKTLSVTTQAGLRHIYAPGERKLRQRTLHLKFPNLRGKWYTDTMFSTCKSLRQFDCAQIITNGYGFDIAYPLASKDEAHYALTCFIQDVGIPQTLVMDNALEQSKGEMRKVINAHHIQVGFTVPHAPWRNKAEAAIRDLKAALRRTMRSSGAPLRTWCFALE